ncbi:MAG: tetratricopeptide repeat protein [Candidatus Eisenbacteria bacterium]|nr:tetratricopeptide repeat protein [Candidatus Eisenbacteria bacterium]
MDCESVRKGRLAERYREGHLSPEEAEEYERHYFSCDRCFQDLRLEDLVAERISAEGEALFAEEIVAESAVGSRGAAPVSGTIPARRRPLIDLRKWWSSLARPAWAGGLVAATAVAVIAIVSMMSMNRDAALKRCWTPSAHPYIASELRGAEEIDEFRQGMESYAAGRYKEAADRLSRSAEVDPRDADIHFYRGVALLMSGRPRAAREALQTASGLVPASELYRWYLAQAQLMSGEVAKAEESLRPLAAGDEYAVRARALLDRIAEVRRD